MKDLLELFPNLNFEDEPFQDASPDVSDEPVTELDLAPFVVYSITICCVLILSDQERRVLLFHMIYMSIIL